jgi:hypothetical protein
LCQVTGSSCGLIHQQGITGRESNSEIAASVVRNQSDFSNGRSGVAAHRALKQNEVARS